VKAARSRLQIRQSSRPGVVWLLLGRRAGGLGQRSARSERPVTHGRMQRNFDDRGDRVGARIRRTGIDVASSRASSACNRPSLATSHNFPLLHTSASLCLTDAQMPNLGAVLDVVRVQDSLLVTGVHAPVHRAHRLDGRLESGTPVRLRAAARPSLRTATRGTAASPRFWSPPRAISRRGWLEIRGRGPGLLPFRRMPEPRGAGDFLVQTSLAWTRTLWGRVFPDRRRRAGCPPPDMPERRRVEESSTR
jgi:hypothetical protein